MRAKRALCPGILKVDRGADVERLVRLLGVDHALLLAASGSLQQRLAGLVQVLERLGVLFAAKVSPLKIEQPIDGDVDDVLDPATVHSNFVRMSVLEHNLDKGSNH